MDSCVLEHETSLRTAWPMRRNYVLCLTGKQLHRMAYLEWGDPASQRVLVCIHGLTRNGHDFDVLAKALSHEYRVICPDIAGRGASDWLHNKTDYAVEVYAAHLLTLLGRLDVAEVDWLGTSMGGLIGMFLASLEHSPIRKLILNDIGPVLPGSALARIAEYVGLAPVFASMAVAEAYLRRIFAGFGPLSDKQWHTLTSNSLRRCADGWRMNYDPSIGDAMRSALVDHDVAMWDIYDRIECPTLVFHGMNSDLLRADTVAEMSQRGPLAQCIEVPQTGHAPMLMSEEQISRISTFLHED